MESTEIGLKFRPIAVGKYMPHRIVIGLFIPFVVYVVFLIAEWTDIIRTHGSNAVGTAIFVHVFSRPLFWVFFVIATVAGLKL